MSWRPEDLIDYSKEVKFQVGHLVEIDIPEIPLENRDCTWGLIIGIKTRFPLTKTHRSIDYVIKLAGSYVRKSNQMIGGLKGEFVCIAKYLKLKEKPK